MNKSTRIYTIEELKALKTCYGFTCEDIRKHCRLSISTIQKVFGDLNKHPRRETLSELSKAMDALLPKEHSGGMIAESQRYHAGPSHGSSALQSSGGVQGSGTLPIRSGCTYGDYLQLELSPEARIEIIDGIIYDIAAPTLTHQDVVGFFLTEFSGFIKKNRGKCKAYISPVDVRLDYQPSEYEARINDNSVIQDNSEAAKAAGSDDLRDTTVVQPDFLVVCDRSKVSDGRSIKGAPDFILEVVSPSSRKMDTNLKRKKYREAGVREYWIIDYESAILIKNVFSPEERITLHSFEDRVPVEIYDGKLVIDLSELQAYISL